tara:strand:- start:480 stop:1220 length:741 start_codon:yes stop_codon:yes gene_type:complete
MAISNKINQSSSHEKRRFNIKYILAEIFLITAGILIALGIDNLNSERIEQKEINEYLVQIKNELEFNLKYGDRWTKPFEQKINQNKRVINILHENQRDSISVLKDILFHIQTVSNLKPNIPILEEFLNQDFLPKIKNDSLRENIKTYKFGLEIAETMNRFDREEQRDVVKPFLMKNINLGKIHTEFDYEKNKGPSSKFDVLFNDLEFFNMVNSRGERLRRQLGTIKYLLFYMKTTIDLIDKELNSK